MVASMLNRVGRSPRKIYRIATRIAIAARLWNISLRLAAMERRRCDLDAQSRRAILQRLELQRQVALLSGQSLIPVRGTAPVLVRSMGQAVAR